MPNQTSNKTLPIMIGTAGHVDHGKTSLVRNLTGFDTDRLKEEKERGLSIDLAVAPFRLSYGSMAGIIDVPGHLDFIRNMVAGATAINVLILVIAADDSVMPQTKEHLEIAKLLGLSSMMVVLTKMDLVDEETQRLAVEEAADLMKSAGFLHVSVIGVSNQTGAGMDEVRRTLEKLVYQTPISEDSRAFRMHIRQAFPMKGHGTIATGVPISGSIQVGDRLELLPKGTRTSLRAAHNYRRKTGQVRANISSALNLRDVAAGDLKRGMVIAVPGIYQPTRSVLVSLQNSSGKSTLSRTPHLKFHCGTLAVQASCKLIDKTTLPPNEEAFAQIKFTDLQVLAAGDRFVLRQSSPSATLGGGIILSSREFRIRRNAPNLKVRFQCAHEAVKNRDYFLCELLAGPNASIQTRELRRLTQHGDSEALRLIEEKQKAGLIEDLGAGGWLLTARVQEITFFIKKHLQRYHKNNQYTWGMEPGYVCKLLELEAGNFKKLFRFLGADKEMVIKHGRLALKDFQPAMDDRLIQLRESTLDRLHQASPNWVARNNLVEEMNHSKSDFKTVSRLLQEEGLILLMGKNFLLSNVFHQCRETLLKLFEKSKEVDVAMFREATGLSRNASIAILEAFDSEGTTKRVGDIRVLRDQRLVPYKKN